MLEQAGASEAISATPYFVYMKTKTQKKGNHINKFPQGGMPPRTQCSKFSLELTMKIFFPPQTNI